MKQGRSKQRGMSLWGVLAAVFGVLIVFWIAIEVAPEYLTATTVQKCVEDAKVAGGSNFSTVQQRFDSCLTTNGIRDLSYKDLTPKGSAVTIAWTRKLSIVGNISLLLEFEAQAPK
ncbi:MAG: DUF4845 domain-containing protein [Betaproteobacteria bacterium]|nr:DUF4845 domain-containing protein [Betaproteobacteria bacterium]